MNTSWSAMKSSSLIRVRIDRRYPRGVTGRTQAIKAFGTDDISMPIVSVARDVPVPGSVPVYALIACNA